MPDATDALDTAALRLLTTAKLYTSPVPRLAEALFVAHAQPGDRHDQDQDQGQD